MISSETVSRLVASFATGDDGLARKSQDLVVHLLEHTPKPFSRKQYEPGHITCTGLVLHPDRDAFLLVHHKRLDRWLLPGGHVEPEDAEIWDAAIREVREETGALIDRRPDPQADPHVGSAALPLIGIDVHGIPPKRQEPYHLHHDLIFGMRASSATAAPIEARTGPARPSKRAGTLSVSPERGSVVRASSSDEVRAVVWCEAGAWDAYQLPESIRISAVRAFEFLSSSRS